MNENKTETTPDNSEEVIDECPYEISPVAMEYCVNEEHKDSNQNDYIEENDTEVRDDVG